MMRKAYLATSALVAAAQMALAAQYGKLPPGQTPATIRQLQRDALTKKGMILDRNGVPIAVLRLPVLGKNGADGEYKPPPITPGKHDNFSRSKNALFLSYFGWAARVAASKTSSSYSYCISYNSHNSCVNYEHIKYSQSLNASVSAAQPFSGASTANLIRVAVGGGFFGSPGKQGKVAIYHSTAKCGNSTTPSCPGNPVAGASGTFSAPSNIFCCQDMVTVSFPPASLKRKERYWVVMSAKAGSELEWFAESSNFAQGAPMGEDYKDNVTEKFHETYRTSKSGHSGTYHSTNNYSTNGWIHTNGFTIGEWPAAFAVE